MVKCQLQCMTGKILQAEIDVISKSVIIKNMIEGVFLPLSLHDLFLYIYIMVNDNVHRSTCTLVYILCVSFQLSCFTV